MLGPLRKFSTSIYAKILLGIIVIPFIFWGMGGSFIGGNKNVVVIIEDEKYSVQDFGNFIQENYPSTRKIDAKIIEELLSAFISEKLIENEVENFGIKLSDNSLSKLIRNQKNFKRENKFSRVEYEKFLIANNLTSVAFEKNIAKFEKKKQLTNLIGAGLLPPPFLVNITYNKINQKRNIELINLNDVFKNNLNFSDDQIKSYFNNNTDRYKETYKSIKFLKLLPEKLINNKKYNDLFYEKIDEIDDIIVRGENLNSIINKFNLEKPNLYTLNKSGRDKNLNKISNLSEDLVKKIFSISDSEPTTLIESEEKFFVIEIIKTEKITKDINNASIKNEIISDLKKEAKREYTSRIISKINQKNFSKLDFDKLSKDESVTIRKVKIKNINDNKILKKELIRQIYSHSEKEVIVAHDIDLSEIFLIYIEKIENVNIDVSSEEYQEYLQLSEIKIKNDLYNTYDAYIKNRYKIDINYKALDTVKNYFIN